jgi:hypothetical protein
MARSSTFGTPEFGMDRRMAVGTVRDSRSERILFPRRPGVRDWSRALCLAEQHPGSGRGREAPAERGSVLYLRDTVSGTYLVHIPSLGGGFASAPISGHGRG